jgi:hypothetical protein
LGHVSFDVLEGVRCLGVAFNVSSIALGLGTILTVLRHGTLRFGHSPGLDG